MSSLRKVFSVLVLSVTFMVCGTVAFVQEAEGAENSIAIDAFTLFKGFTAWESDPKANYFNIAASFEHVVAPHFSIGANFDMYYIKYDSVDALYLAGTGEFRHYPQSADCSKFFMGAELGLNRFAIDGKAKAKDGGFFGLLTALKVGYKLTFSAKQGIYMEPSMSYVLSKMSSADTITPLGWQGGLRIGYTF